MKHLPVMLEEAIEHLAIRQDGCYVDCTFGRGGHSAAVLSRLGEHGRLVALDRDLEAVESAVAAGLRNDRRFTIQHCCFSNVAAAVRQFDEAAQVDGVLMDLGVSSPQLDDPERGFSFLKEGPLDMRMNVHAGLSAQEWLSKVSEQQLTKVLFEFGEERFARRIARAIVTERNLNAIASTRQLAKIVENAVPIKEKHKHPATRTFQAIRIEVNQELEELKLALQGALDILKPGGRLVVITFHSLEDRIVKRFINHESGAKYDPGKLPIREADIAKGSLKKIGKALRAKPEEVQENVRARSATMRVAEKLQWF